MNLVSVRLITDDIEGMVAFYEKVLGVTASRPAPIFAEFNTPNGTLAIGARATVDMMAADAARPADNHTAIIEFIVEDVDAVFAELAWVRDVVSEPKTMPWGNRSLLIRDPDGNLLNFFTPASDAAVEKFSRFER